MKNKFYHFAMSISFSLMLTTSFLAFTKDADALSVSYKEKLCEKNFYDSNYKPYLEKTCSLLWQKWTFDILNTHE